VAKNQYDLCLEILRRFHREKLLGNLVLIGSWCLVFYEIYFRPTGKFDVDALKTRDIDFLIPSPSKITHKTDVPALFSDLGFKVTIGGAKGIIRLSHPDLTLEFLVPERGRGQDKPVALPQLGMNAVALRFLNFLTDNIIPIKVEDFYVFVPHPINFSLHKLIVSRRRLNKDKAVRDREMGLRILNDLIEKGESGAIQRVFNPLPPRWRKEILSALHPTDDRKIIALLQQ